MPEHILVAIYGLLLAEIVLLFASNVAFLGLLRWRHANVWRSLGSPWFSLMHRFQRPGTREFTRYVRNRHYRKLPDPLTRYVGSLVQFQLRFGPWVIITLCVMALIVIWAVSRFRHVS
jgi:hypothetical protein